jgi:hypothetical protein
MQNGKQGNRCKKMREKEDSTGKKEEWPKEVDQTAMQENIQHINMALVVRLCGTLEG